MGIGAVEAVTVGECTDIYCLDFGLYETPRYGAIYLLDTARPAVVDTGTGANYDLLQQALDTVGIAPDDLAVIALTHIHLDHAGGAGLLAADCPNADIYVHKQGARHVVEPIQIAAGTKRVVGELWEYHIEPEAIPEHRVHPMEDGQRIDLDDRALETVYAPGHAPHQVAYYDQSSDALFTADAVGMWLPDPELLPVTTPPPNFDLDLWLDSHDRLRAINSGTLFYPHFGPRPADNVIDEHERLLRRWVREIAAKRDELADDSAVIEYFHETAALPDALGDPAGSIPTRLTRS